jgi:hypothetical protein
MCTEGRNRRKLLKLPVQRYIISVIRIEKTPLSQLNKIKARLTLLQQATENSKGGKTKQRTKDQETETKKEQKNKIKH